MSPGNVEILYQTVDALNRRDLPGMLEFADDDVEVVSRIAAMEGGLHGHDGMRRWFESWLDAFPDYHMEVIEVREYKDVTIASLQARGHGAGSDVPFLDEIWQAARWRDGKCVWWRVCNTREEALEAAGLSE